MVTAQARLHELVGGVGSLEEDYGRIGARFDTRLALTTEDVEKVLEGRVVKKEEERIPEIQAFYQQHEGAFAPAGGITQSESQTTLAVPRYPDTEQMLRRRGTCTSCRCHGSSA